MVDPLQVIIGLMVVRNEAERYLSSALHDLARWTDHTVVYDDRSTDETPKIAESSGAEVHVRPDSVPAFLDHEGEFRQAAWEAMGNCDGDWILSLDADEYLSGPVDELLDDDVTKSFKVNEVFDISGDTPMVRIDGYWNQITAARLCAWTDDSDFLDRRLGCGSLPEVALQKVVSVSDPQINHFGYARAADRKAKYDRYAGDRNHNPKHIASILQKGQLISLR